MSRSLIGKDPLNSRTGKFKDADLESKYQEYVARKKAAKEPARDRLDWKEIRDYWLNDSPMARGNAYNTKYKNVYDYNEVNLVTGNRVDSYDRIKGEIISRKASDFDDITESTFREYLNEAKRKYSPGTTIRSNAYPEIDGTKLKGKLILQVPDSNLKAVNRAAFEKWRRI